MLRVLFIRHGQSEANAGLRSRSASGIPLTVLGKQQADAVAKSFGEAPSRIVYSPYVRATQTSEPTRARFPSASAESWPVQEFTYLSAERCHDTTSAERIPMVQAYWASADPDSVDGPGVESFRGFIKRVDDAIARLRMQTGLVAVFTHGQFMQGAMWRLGMGPQPSGVEHMAELRAFMTATPVPNASIVTVDLEGAPRISPIDVSHLGALPITY